MEKRTCKTCDKSTKLENFPLSRGYRLHTCKKCVNFRGRKYRTKWAKENYSSLIDRRFKGNQLVEKRAIC